MVSDRYGHRHWCSAGQADASGGESCCRGVDADADDSAGDGSGDGLRTWCRPFERRRLRGRRRRPAGFQLPGVGDVDRFVLGSSAAAGPSMDGRLRQVIQPQWHH